MKTYRSHKLVTAGKITAARMIPNTCATLTLDDGQEFNVDRTWLFKHLEGEDIDALVGGYLVTYQDGYSSWSPAPAFEAGYTAVGTEGPALAAALENDVSLWQAAAMMAGVTDEVLQAAQISSAVSARRIADALQIIAAGVDMMGVTSPHALNELMENAGQSFALGMRGR